MLCLSNQDLFVNINDFCLKNERHKVAENDKLLFIERHPVEKYMAHDYDYVPLIPILSELFLNYTFC